MYAKIIKPVFDRILAFIGFLCLLFIFIPVTVALLIVNNGSAFFIQSRPGKNGKLFNIIKFKTMNDKRDKNGQLLPDDVRLTRVGRTVRKLSLDEIPQLINVLKGDMSLIGPRPLLPEYLPLYSKKQARRHEVKPGITGWAQVNGRNAISWQEKFDFDVWYADHVTFGLDCSIAWKTVLNVLKREGISGGGVETMTKFTGN